MAGPGNLFSKAFTVLSGQKFVVAWSIIVQKLNIIIINLFFSTIFSPKFEALTVI